MKIIYRLNVYVTQPLSVDPDDADYPTLDGATDASFRRGIEKSAMACLRRMEQDCDVELMDFSVEDE